VRGAPRFARVALVVVSNPSAQSEGRTTILALAPYAETNSA
jgi:hypothetical protein